MEEFRQNFPQIARLLAQPEALSSSSSLAAKATQESWQSAASQLLSAAWKIKEAHLFHAPVDVKKLGIPDYLQIIKKPMDFGTIKVGSSEKAVPQRL